MSKPRKKPRARKGSRGRTYTISCTDEQWAVQDGADRAGKSVSAWFVECALTGWRLGVFWPQHLVFQCEKTGPVRLGRSEKVPTWA